MCEHEIYDPGCLSCVAGVDALITDFEDRSCAVSYPDGSVGVVYQQEDGTLHFSASYQPDCATVTGMYDAF